MIGNSATVMVAAGIAVSLFRAGHRLPDLCIAGFYGSCSWDGSSAEFTGGNLSTARLHRGCLQTEQRSKNFALIGMAWSVGLILARPLRLLGSSICKLRLMSLPGWLSECASGYLYPCPNPYRQSVAKLPDAAEDFNPIVPSSRWPQAPAGRLLLVTACSTLPLTASTHFYPVRNREIFGPALASESGYWIGGIAVGASTFLLVPRLVPRFWRYQGGARQHDRAIVFDVAIFLFRCLAGLLCHAGQRHQRIHLSP